jgi:glycosyltransferase involved in cell wall biosynthesis
MAASLPILASTRCGAIWDLVFPGQNGLLFDPLQPTQIADRLVQFTHFPPDTLARMGQVSRQRIEHYTPETWAIALIDCIRQLQGGRVGG